jgi:hypothetical protein
VEAVVALIPDAWLDDDPGQRRAEYAEYLRRRLAAPRAFAEEAERARG